MVIALCWENARAFDRWVDNIRILRHSDDDDPEVVRALIENMPTPWRHGAPSVSGRDDRLCSSEIRADAYCQQGNDGIATVDEQVALKTLQGNLELVGSR